VSQNDPRTEASIGAAMEVHRELGPGLLEKAYQEAMAVELQERGVPFSKEVELAIVYKGIQLATVYRADLVCYEGIIIEIKAIRGLTDLESAQIIHYPKVTKHTLGLLLNFGTPSLEFKRFANNQSA